jgi:Na+/H+-dicarboxylate symporter
LSETARISPANRVLIALAAGLAGGIAISAFGGPALFALVSFIEPIGTLWVNAIRMTVIPLVVSLLIVSVASVDVGTVGRMGWRALLTFVALLSASALFAALVAPPLFARLPIDAAATASLGESGRAAVTVAGEGVSRLPTFSQWLVELVPTNPIRAAADETMLPLVIFALLFALASTRTNPDLRQSLVRFFQAISATMLVLVRWIIAVAPLGVFALMLGLAARVGASTVGALGYFVLIVCALLFVQTVVLYPVAVVAGGVSFGDFAAGTFPAQAVACSSRSSLASLPALIEGAEGGLGLPPDIAGFVLPLAVSTFKISSPIAWIAGALFIAKLYGVDLDARQVVVIGAVSVVLSFSSPGIPSGSLVLMAPLYTSLGLPIEGIGILIALDVFPDIFKTVSNVTADMTVATILARGKRAPASAVRFGAAGASDPSAVALLQVPVLRSHSLWSPHEV